MAEKAPFNVMAQAFDGPAILGHLSAEEYAAKEKKLLRKIDLRIMPCLFCMIVLKYASRITFCIEVY